MPVVRDLADCPQHLPLIARWQWEVWDHKRWTLQQTIEEYRAWCQRDALPWGVIALENDQPVGCMALLANDLSDRSDLSPWLACLYVVPEHRGGDIARRLGEALEERARRLGYKKLYMWTEHNPAAYRRLGWQEMFKTREYEMDVTVMCKSYD